MMSMKVYSSDLYGNTKWTTPAPRRIGTITVHDQGRVKVYLEDGKLQHRLRNVGTVRTVFL